MYYPSSIFQGTAFAVNVKGEMVKVDPKLLFQRVLLIGMNKVIELRSLFAYELYSFPPALFDEKVMMRTGEKSEMKTALLS